MCFLSPTSDPTQNMTSTIYAPPTTAKAVTPVTPVTPAVGTAVPAAVAGVTGQPVIQPIGTPKVSTTPQVSDPGKDIREPKAEDSARKGLAMKKGDRNKRGDTGLNIKKA